MAPSTDPTRTTSCTLKELNVRRTGLSEVGVRALMEALHENKTKEAGAPLVIILNPMNQLTSGGLV